MAHMKNIVALAKAALEQDRDKAVSVVQCLIAEERRVTHHTAAERLQSVLDYSFPPGQGTAKFFGTHVPGAKGLLQLKPRVVLDDVMLSEYNRDVVASVVEEHQRRDMLREHNLQPSNRVLFCGDPGNGKTMLAEALAHKLDLPFLVVSLSDVFGSYLGDTPKLIAETVKEANKRSCLLFIDEFDAVAKERLDKDEIGEVKRAVNTLIVSVDSLSSNVLLVAATNHPQMLDRAIWRRFQVIISLDAPTPQDCLRYCRSHPAFATNDADFSYAACRLAPESGNLAFPNYSDMSEFCNSVLRKRVLGGSIADAIEVWNRRAAVRELSIQRAHESKS